MSIDEVRAIQAAIEDHDRLRAALVEKRDAAIRTYAAEHPEVSHRAMAPSIGISYAKVSAIVAERPNHHYDRKWSDNRVHG